MKISVIVPDSKIIINGEPRIVTLPNDMPKGLHAIQWYAGDSGEGYGELELRDGNETKTDSTFDITPYIKAWENAGSE